MKNRFTAVFVPAEEGGFTAFLEEIPNVVTEGDTLEEARDNLKDALILALEVNREDAARLAVKIGGNEFRETFDLELSRVEAKT